MGYLNAVVSEATGTLRRASEGIKITVDQHNIMQAARIIAAESVHLKRQINARAEQMNVDPMGGDPVSIEAAEVLTLKLVDDDDSYVNRCFEYADMLKSLAEQLYQAAQTYGFTEEQVTAQFAAAKDEGGRRPIDLARPAWGSLSAV